jgi:hypothetical protein
LVIGKGVMRLIRIVMLAVILCLWAIASHFAPILGAAIE